MLSTAGAKLLDFGLAKLKPSHNAPVGVSAPTVSAGLTSEGAILGTLQYMAPEQLEGKEADARTDIFAFGALVYEMVTGRKAFEGTSQASLIAAIMHVDPPAPSVLQPITPPALDHVVRTCLVKDPDGRWQSAGDVGHQLLWVAEGGVVAGLALSPDGSQLAFATGGIFSSSQLWVRPRDAVEARALPGTDGSSAPFWSPDGRSIGFFTATELNTVDLMGGAPQTVCAVPFGVGVGGAWNDDDVIVFSVGASQGLFQVPAAGGEPTSVTTIDQARGEIGHLFPQFLPDGEHRLFVAGRPGPSDLFVTSLASAALGTTMT